MYTIISVEKSLVEPVWTRLISVLKVASGLRILEHGCELRSATAYALENVVKRSIVICGIVAAVVGCAVPQLLRARRLSRC
jgi:hypothetical protein